MFALRIYLSPMKLGYGYRREAKDLKAAGAEAVYIDGEKTRRMERKAMLDDLRGGETVILLAPGDLGAVGELKQLRQLIADAGATIEVVETEAKRRGPPRDFNPTPDQETHIRALWHDLTVEGTYAHERAQKIMGFDVTRNQLNHAFGPRSKPRPFKRDQ